MSSLFNILPEGTFHLQNFVNEDHQKEIVDECRKLLAEYPLMQPKTKGGYDLALRVTSWGRCGWFGEYGRYYYMHKHQNGQRFPDIPPIIWDAMQNSLTECKLDLLQLDTVLLNWYPPETGKLGRHQDVTEEDRTSPIVTMSLGDACIFNIGSDVFEEKGIDVECKSGDVIVMAGPSRLAYHEVKKILPNTSSLLPKGGRISLTGRRVFK